MRGGWGEGALPMKLISTLMFLLTLALVALVVGLHETIAAPPPGPGDRGALVDVLTRDEQGPLLEARRKLVSAEQRRLEAARAREAASAERDAMQDAFEAAFLELSSLELALQEQKKNRKRRRDRKAERSQKKALDSLANAVTAAESELEIVRAALSSAQSELEEAEAREREAREVSDALAREVDTTRALVADLSDEQVRAFQRIHSQEDFCFGIITCDKYVMAQPAEFRICIVSFFDHHRYSGIYELLESIYTSIDANHHIQVELLNKIL